MLKKNVALIGFDLEVLELLESSGNYNIVGYFDMEKKEYDDAQYLGRDTSFEKFSKDIDEVVLSMDMPLVREKMYALYEGKIKSFMAHDGANISKRSKIGIGTVIQCGALVSAYAKLGKGCFVNHDASIHHESSLGDFSIIAPGARVLGRVSIGENCYIGASSTIKEGVKIGSNVTIGAGAVVVNDIEDNSTVVGNPAKRYL
jgi:sugar O-acyltransferase (sialic acid O-acetyltransferase NeuD family)